jgi:uncharacterized membrane protein
VDPATGDLAVSGSSAAQSGIAVFAGAKGTATSYVAAHDGAFFKFAWAYRLYNYVAIMVGAAPPASEQDTPEAKAHAESVASSSPTPAATSIAASARSFSRSAILAGF